MAEPPNRSQRPPGGGTSIDVRADGGSAAPNGDGAGAGPARRRRFRVPRVATIALVSLAALLLAAIAAAAGVRVILRDEILPGTVIAGVDVGGLSPQDAASELAPVVTARETDPVTVTYPDGTTSLAPGDISYTVDQDTTVARAMGAGRQGNVLERSWSEIRSLWTSRTVRLEVVHDDDALDAWVRDLAVDVDRDPFPGDVRAEAASLEVTVTPPQDGVVLRPEETRDLVLVALRSPGAEQVEAPVDITPARVAAADVEAVADDVREALSEPLVLTAPSGAELVLEPAELAPLVGITEVKEGDGWTVEVLVSADGLEQTVGEDVGAFEVAPVDARFDVPRQPPVILDDKDDVTWNPRPAEVGVVPSQDGQTFDPSLAADQLADMVEQGVRSAELRRALIEPEFSTEDARALNIDHLLGTFTTYHACCAARVSNIQRLADMVDQTVVLPGEQFSVNQISGHRTCSRGFRPAGMILNGEIVDVCGGGVSQFGTTTVNAVFFSGLDPDTYKPHSFYISRYPMGREATLNYPSPDIDVRFTNDTGNGILIRTWYTSTSITVSFYGNSDVESVTAIHGSPRNIKPYPTRYRENKRLAPGTSRRIQSGRNGFSVTVTRAVARGGEESRDDWSWTYVPEIQIIERNTSSPAASAEPPQE